MFGYERHDCGRNGRGRMHGAGRGFGGRVHIDFGDASSGEWGLGGGGRGRGRRGRMFGQGELRLVLLKLIVDEPRHGYDLIRAIEELTHGDYAPSPGVVYPTLTMLQDMGLIEEQSAEGTRKKYAVTDEGRRHLEENAEEVAALLKRLEDHGSSRRKSSRPELGRAVSNLMHALRNRVAHEGWNEDLLNEVTDILDDAAKRIERLR